MQGACITAKGVVVMRKRFGWTPAVCAVLLAAVLAGCGAQSQSAAEAASSLPPQSAPVSASAAQEPAGSEAPRRTERRAGRVGAGSGPLRDAAGGRTGPGGAGVIRCGRGRNGRTDSLWQRPVVCIRRTRRGEPSRYTAAAIPGRKAADPFLFPQRLRQGRLWRRLLGRAGVFALCAVHAGGSGGAAGERGLHRIRAAVTGTAAGAFRRPHSGPPQKKVVKRWATCYDSDSRRAPL